MANYKQPIGVDVEMVERRRSITIKTVVGAPTGQGNTGKWLDSLPADKKITVVHVISPLLAEMLQRRGFKPFGWDRHRPKHWVRQAQIERFVSR